MLCKDSSVVKGTQESYFSKSKDIVLKYYDGKGEVTFMNSAVVKVLK